ncbi:hypothetical protein Bhyg_17113 [Pseudolycoriella hygida]|uniref:Uncharacterized protein n=1 Tax=Pseudolycoriella hygida TaxID=35572 RepID=A0A9Q0RTZ7_9DIPT|nr:hypothetical protein Bhyg_17113 [Pseudolycoriella hygida]
MANKIWKTNGPENKYLESLFRSGKLNSSSKPSTVHAMFSAFSNPTFRKHFALVKQKCCPDISTEGHMTITNMVTAEEEERERNEISEIDGIEGSSKKAFDIGSDKAQSQNKFEFLQAPIIPCVYTDGDTKQEKCMVVFMLYSGVNAVSVDTITKPDTFGQICKFSYNWPIAMYNLKSMFQNDRNGCMLVDEIYPKAIAIDAALKQYRENMEDAPKATIEIKLPVEVKPDPTTWKKTFNKKQDGGVVIFLEFECIRKDFAILKSVKVLRIE